MRYIYNSLWRTNSSSQMLLLTTITSCEWSLFINLSSCFQQSHLLKTGLFKQLPLALSPRLDQNRSSAVECMSVCIDSALCESLLYWLMAGRIPAPERGTSRSQLIDYGPQCCWFQLHVHTNNHSSILALYDHNITKWLWNEQ